MATIDSEQPTKASVPCHYPDCGEAVIGHCTLCHSQYCSRHIRRTHYGNLGHGVPVPLCYTCQKHIAAQIKQRLQVDVAYASMLTVLLLTCAGTSFALHGLGHLSASLTLWAFWISVAGFVVALGRLVLKLVQL
jgi:hypothetical protein